MTIVVASLCEKRQCIVIVSDRMMTYGDIMQMEMVSPKVEELFSGSAIAFAGHAAYGIEVRHEVERHKQEIESKSFVELANRIREIYEKIRLKKADWELIRPHGFTYEEFQEGKTTLPPALVAQIWANVYKYPFPFAVLLAGADNHGAHIAEIHPPGILVHLDDIGYGNVGSGSDFANLSLAMCRYDTKWSLELALISTFEAKKMAERVPGVGKETDILIITKKGFKSVSSEDIKELEKLHDNFRTTQNEQRVTMANEIKELLARYKLQK